MVRSHRSHRNTRARLTALRHINLTDILAGFKDGSFDATDLVAAYFARIQAVDHIYNAVIETSANAIFVAKALSNEYRLKFPRGPLHGIPILLKDNMPTLDDTDTACGSIALVGAKPAQEAAVVSALRRAGAIILGKANMAEWSGFRSTSGCSGWSARGGQTTGIYYPGMKASGSISGGAVATALGLCFAALGTEVRRFNYGSMA